MRAGLCWACRSGSSRRVWARSKSSLEDADGNRVSDDFDVTVTAPQTTLTAIAARYDANGDGAIDGSEYQQVKKDWLAGKISYDEFLAVVRVPLSSD